MKYISYLSTNAEGAKINQNVAVGRSEVTLRSVYTNGLYDLIQDLAEPYSKKYPEDFDAGFEFNHAYSWRPYPTETDDMMDITFYLKDGRIASIEMIEHYALRHGYDRAAVC